jgi:hypothetical protein
MRLLCIILALSLYTQAFGYYALSISLPTECQSTHKKQKDHEEKTFCCSSKSKASCDDHNEVKASKSCHIDDDSKPHSKKESKGCCGDQDCDCLCCFHIQSFPVLFYSQHEFSSQSLTNYYKSKFYYSDAIPKDLMSNIFHPPQV